MSCKNLVWGKRRKLFQGCVRVYSLNFRIVWSILDPDSVLHKNSMDWKWQENNNYVKISSNSSKGFESSSTIAIYSSLSSTLSGKTHNVNSPNKKIFFLKSIVRYLYLKKIIISFYLLVNTLNHRPKMVKRIRQSYTKKLQKLVHTFLQLKNWLR